DRPGGEGNQERHHAGDRCRARSRVQADVIFTLQGRAVAYERAPEASRASHSPIGKFFWENTSDLQRKMRAHYKARLCASLRKSAGARTTEKQGKKQRKKQRGGIGIVGHPGACVRSDQIRFFASVIDRLERPAFARCASYGAISVSPKRGARRRKRQPGQGPAFRGACPRARRRGEPGAQCGLPP